jgi:serine/threonine protein kinase
LYCEYTQFGLYYNSRCSYINRTLCGTPNYIAPEILDGKEGHSYEVDVWSLGCIMYTMLVGRPPFETENIKTTYHKIKTNDYRFPSSVTISEDAISLIKMTLSGDPKQRPSLEEIRSHPFFTRHYTPTSLPTSALTVPPAFEDAKLMPALRRDPLKAVNSPSQATKTTVQKLRIGDIELKPTTLAFGHAVENKPVFHLAGATVQSSVTDAITVPVTAHVLPLAQPDATKQAVIANKASLVKIHK